MCDCKKSGFIREQEAEVFLNMIGKILRTWYIGNIMTDKNCCNSNVFTMIIDKLEKSKNNPL